MMILISLNPVPSMRDGDGKGDTPTLSYIKT